MTAPATTRRAGPFLGNGVATTFPFTFKVFATSDIAVTRTVDGIDTTLTLGVNYSVALNPDQDSSPGGTITYPISGTPLASGQTLVAIGALPYDQTADLPSGGNYRALVIENALDRTVMQVQQLAERADRAITLSPSAAGASTTLAAPKANNVIGWNADADALVNYSAADLATVVIAGTAYTDIFNGTGAQTDFVLTANPGSVNALDVAISGVSQVNGVDFTVSGTTLAFTSAPPAGAGNVVARYVAAVPVGSANAQDVTYLPPGAGAVSRTLEGKLHETISLWDFLTPAQIAAAVARTTPVDMTVAIQAFFDACKDGPKGYIPPGSYWKSSQITVDPDYPYHISGAGWNSENGPPRGSVIFDTGNSNGLFVYYAKANYPGGPGGSTPPTNNSDVRQIFSSFSLRGPGRAVATPGSQTVGIEGVNTVVQTGTGVWTYWTNGLVLEDLWISGYSGDGIYMYRGFSATVRNCYVIKNARCGIHLFKTGNVVDLYSNKVLVNGIYPSTDINCNILIDGEINYENENAVIGGTNDVSYGGLEGAVPLTSTGVVVAGGGATVTAGSFVVGNWYIVTSLGTTDWTLIGLPSAAVGVMFKATGAGLGTGTAVTPATATVTTTAPHGFSPGHVLALAGATDIAVFEATFSGNTMTVIADTLVGGTIAVGQTIAANDGVGGVLGSGVTITALGTGGGGSISYAGTYTFSGPPATIARCQVRATTGHQQINTIAPAVVLTTPSTTQLTFPTPAAVGTYPQCYYLSSTSRPTLVVAPYVAGVGINDIRGIQIHLGYSEACSGPAIYIGDRVKGWTVHGGHVTQNKIFAKAGSRGGLVQGCAFLGGRAGVYLESAYSATVGENSHVYTPTFGTPTTYIGGLPIPTTDGIYVQGMYLGQGSFTDYRPAETTALGVGVLANAITTSAIDAQKNSAFGYYALNELTTGFANVAVGAYSGLKSQTTVNSTLVGVRAGELGTNLQNLVAVGFRAGYGVTTASNDTYVGGVAGGKDVDGPSNGSNTFIGATSGRTTSSQVVGSSTILGAQSQPFAPQTGLANFNAIGYDAAYQYITANPTLAGNLTVIGNTSVTRTIIRGTLELTTTYTVATLPAAATALRNTRTMVTDANATTFNSVVAGGGANIMPVFCDGANWRIG